jgi:hypothetical protein
VGSGLLQQIGRGTPKRHRAISGLSVEERELWRVPGRRCGARLEQRPGRRGALWSDCERAHAARVIRIATAARVCKMGR